MRFVTPADVIDLAILSGARTPLMWAVAKEMITGGSSWALRDGDRTVGLFGFYPVEEGIGEAWFNIAPDAGGAVLKVVRKARLTLPTLGYREIVTICTSEQGKRIARAIGFSPVNPIETGELWSCNFSEATRQPRRSRRSSKPSSAAPSPTSRASKAKSTRHPPAADAARAGDC